MLNSPRTWARDELSAWRGRMPTRRAISDALDYELSVRGQLFRFDITPDEVVCRPKTHDQIALGQPESVAREIRDRAAFYTDLFRQSLPLLGLQREMSLAVEVSDITPPIPGLPLFTFQRRRGEPILLLPDVDLMMLSFLESTVWTDRTPFRSKPNQAIFVGSTTGGHITMDVVERLALPRLRAAVAFKDSAQVKFLLPRIVQFDSPETEAAVRALGLGGEDVDWSDQLRYRHLISMDGNGATCSRVAIALKSNSVLLKYDSDHELFYFKGLQPGRHYVPVSSDAQVEQVVADCAHHAPAYGRIAAAGRRYFRAHLTRWACVRYTAALLRGYAAMLDEADGLARAP